MEDSSHIIQRAEQENIEYIQLWFTNIAGKLKSMSIHVSQLGEAIEEGVGFDGSSVPGYAKVEKSDLILIPDLNTFSVLPWNPKGRKVARLFCNVCYPNGEPHENDPRNTLENYLNTVKKKGYEFFVGAEIEFYLFKNDNEPFDEGEYLDSTPYDKADKFRTDLALDLQNFGFLAEKIHHEISPGQNELDLRYSTALNTADNILASRQSLQALAEGRGLKANYQPKPLPDKMGNGLHCHHSLGDPETGENLLYNPSGKYRMSKLARNFLGGELEHAAALTALAASTPNSYERLVPRYEAPVYKSWGGPNRTVMVRIPGYEIRRGSGMRFEYRVPDPVCNPYLLFTGILSAGIDGINKETEIQPPVEENIFEMSKEEREKQDIETLPDSLHESLDALHSDDIIRKTLGEELTRTYIQFKREIATKQNKK